MYGIYRDGQVIARFVAPMSVESNVPVFVSDTLSLDHVAARRPSQRWEISSQLMPLTHTAHDLFSLFVEKGSFSPIQVIVPQNMGVISNRVRTASISTGTGSAGSATITVTTAGKIPRGTLLKFTNHNKIYMTTSERNGNGSVSIFPKLVSAVSSTTMLWQDDVLAEFYLDTNVVKGMTFTDGILMDLGEIKLLENKR